jgi:hypothetical protein
VNLGQSRAYFNHFLLFADFELGRFRDLRLGLPNDALITQYTNDEFSRELAPSYAETGITGVVSNVIGNRALRAAAYDTSRRSTGSGGVAVTDSPTREMEPNTMANTFSPARRAAMGALISQSEGRSAGGNVPTDLSGARGSLANSSLTGSGGAGSEGTGAASGSTSKKKRGSRGSSKKSRKVKADKKKKARKRVVIQESESESEESSSGEE